MATDQKDTADQATASGHAIEHVPDNNAWRNAAERGHVATDKFVTQASPLLCCSQRIHMLNIPPPLPRYGQPLVQFDAAAERRLRLKIDFFIVPTVALLYLFCFIDRANIGSWARGREPAAGGLFVVSAMSCCH